MRSRTRDGRLAVILDYEGARPGSEAEAVLDAHGEGLHCEPGDCTDPGSCSLLGRCLATEGDPC